MCELEERVTREVNLRCSLKIKTNVSQREEGRNGLAPGGEVGLNCSDMESNFKAPDSNCEREREVDNTSNRGGRGEKGDNANWTGSSAGQAFSWEPYLRSDTYKGYIYCHSQIYMFLCFCIPIFARFCMCDNVLFE